MKSHCFVHMSDFTSVISHIFFQVRLPDKDSCEASFGGAASNQPGDTLPTKKAIQQPQDTSSSKSTQPAQSTQDEKETGWPIFFDGEKLLPTAFKEDLWKCPFCDHWTNRIRQHLKKHLDKIPDWTAADNFCKEVSAMKRRRLEKKREADPNRKETRKKGEKKRAGDPKRQKDDPKRRETLKRTEIKRASNPKRQKDDPKRKETLKGGRSREQMIQRGRRLSRGGRLREQMIQRGRRLGKTVIKPKRERLQNYLLRKSTLPNWVKSGEKHRIESTSSPGWTRRKGEMQSGGGSSFRKQYSEDLNMPAQVATEASSRNRSALSLKS